MRDAGDVGCVHETCTWPVRCRDPAAMATVLAVEAPTDKHLSASVAGHVHVGDHIEFEVVAVNKSSANGTEHMHRSQHRYTAFADLHKALRHKLSALPATFPVSKSLPAPQRVEALSNYLSSVSTAIGGATPPEEWLSFLHVLAPSGETPSELKLMTFNLGLLRVRVFGMTAFGSPPHTEQRFKHIPAAINACGADVVALQEIYEKAHVSALLKHVGGTYPYFARADNQAWSGAFHNGLLFLSKHPVDGMALRKHEQASALERWFGSKSCLSCRISTPLGKLCLVNMHTTAGGGVDPENADVDSVREAELAEAVELCDAAAADGCVPPGRTARSSNNARPLSLSRSLAPGSLLPPLPLTRALHGSLAGTLLQSSAISTWAPNHLRATTATWARAGTTTPSYPLPRPWDARGTPSRHSTTSKSSLSARLSASTTSSSSVAVRSR